MLTIDELDPVGKIPEFKFCAVKVERVSGPAGREVGHEGASAGNGHASHGESGSNRPGEPAGAASSG